MKTGGIVGIYVGVVVSVSVVASDSAGRMTKTQKPKVVTNRKRTPAFINLSKQDKTEASTRSRGTKQKSNVSSITKTTNVIPSNELLKQTNATSPKEMAPQPLTLKEAHEPARTPELAQVQARSYQISIGSVNAVPDCRSSNNGEAEVATYYSLKKATAKAVVNGSEECVLIDTGSSASFISDLKIKPFNERIPMASTSLFQELTLSVLPDICANVVFGHDAPWKCEPVLWRSQATLTVCGLAVPNVAPASLFEYLLPDYEVTLLDANAEYAHIRYLYGSEITVSTRYLAPIGRNRNSAVYDEELDSNQEKPIGTKAEEHLT
ncbi:unnamed protein product [Nezara viridula]|uniref:Uncharacterized protein n=1 Tax=Nezara viridula TaxID=85310 RepID=A0A9P0E4X8_NEZVI|nr:unnamed protein product [Nezara viridula]